MDKITTITSSPHAAAKSAAPVTEDANASSSILSRITEAISSSSNSANVLQQTSCSSQFADAQRTSDEVCSTCVVENAVTSRCTDVNTIDSHEGQHVENSEGLFSWASTRRNSSSASSVSSNEEIIQFRGKGVQKTVPELSRTFQPSITPRLENGHMAPQTVFASSVEFPLNHSAADATMLEGLYHSVPRPEHEATCSTESSNGSDQPSFQIGVVATTQSADLLIDHPALGPPTAEVATVDLGWDPNRGVTPWVSRSKPGIGWCLPRRPQETVEPEFILTEREREEAIKEFWEGQMASIDQRPAFGDQSSQLHAITFPQGIGGTDSVEQDDSSMPSSSSLPDAVATTITVTEDTGSVTPPPVPGSLLAVQASISRAEGSGEFGESSDAEAVEQDEDDEMSIAEPALELHGTNGKDLGTEAEVSGQDEENEGSDETSDSQEAYTYRHRLQEEIDARYAHILADRERRLTGMTQHEAFGLDSFDDFENGSSSTIPEDENSDASGGEADEDRLIQQAMDYYAAMPKPSRPGKAAALSDAMDISNVDSYDDSNFDVMDLNRPSLHKNRKGKGKSKVHSDPDSVDNILNQMLEAERGSKKRRREARNELRKQGLLGKKSRATDDGKQSKQAWASMTFTAFNSAIRTFLTSAQRCAYFHASDPAKTAALAHIAQRLKLQLKTEGKGKHGGRLTLRKHARDPFAFDAAVFDRAMAHAATMWPAPAPAAGAKAGRADDASEERARRVKHYRDGEVIGAGAKEVGADNVGHQMMLKMGWKPGMAIGAENNKGIMLPVETVFKSSKTGIGGSR